MHSIGPTTFNPLLINNNIPHVFHQENHPPVMDLCIKNKRESPSYTLSYPSPRHSPGYHDTQQPDPHFAKNPKAVSERSEDSKSPKSLDATDYVGSRNIPTIVRPFKAFPSNPLALTMNILASIAPPRIADPLQSKEPSTVMYEEFRDKILAKVQDYKGTNMNMRRNQIQDQSSVDPSYWERRKKNNEAAKRSRDARKAREDEIAIRCAFLEQENIRLKANLVSVEAEVERLKNVLFHR